MPSNFSAACPVVESGRKKILVLVVAYNAEHTIQNVISRVPLCLSEHDTQILIIDDSSGDRTFQKAHELRENGCVPVPITVLHNDVNQGYGGNQKIGFHYAIKGGFDVVALLHGDGQYAPERLPDLLQPLLAGEAEAVFGSRMSRPFDALKGGMPLYKFIGNRILTFLQNRILGAALTEFHSGYRAFSVEALQRLPFERNANGFQFDTEIIIQFLRAGLRIKELPIPTYYGDEIRLLNGMKYAFDVIKTTLAGQAQDYGIFYERKFDVSRAWENNPLYQPKSFFESPHTLTLERVPQGSRVADIGCASGYISRALKEKGCRVTAIDQFQMVNSGAVDDFIECDLDRGDFPIDAGSFDYILMLDIIEHLRSPERLLDSVRDSRTSSIATKVIFSTGNIAFFITRLGLLLGWFNYGARGILDLTHTRLFTFSSARRLFEQSGYRVEEVKALPAPFPLVLGNNLFGKSLLAINKALIRISKRLFAYQIFMVCTPLPTLHWLLERANAAGKERIKERIAV
jgi:glycosyltransferase involved in cell wall biosynthesis